MELSVTFATACWERDWRHILCDSKYLSELQIQNHCFAFSEKLLVINNVDDLSAVKKQADILIAKGVLTRYIVAEDVFDFFKLNKADFNPWQYYNALAPLNAIYHCQSDYLLYHTGDVYLKKPVSWIEKAIRYMEKDPRKKVANLIWNENRKEV